MKYTVSAIDEARDDYLSHYEDCNRCGPNPRPGTTCPEGDRLLKRVADIAAQQIAPMPKEAGRA